MIRRKLIEVIPMCQRCQMKRALHRYERMFEGDPMYVLDFCCACAGIFEAVCKASPKHRPYRKFMLIERQPERSRT
jgi:hypothetical protein